MIIMIAGCITDEEDKEPWKQKLTETTKQLGEEVNFIFLKDIIEVGFHLHDVDIVFIGPSLIEYEDELRTMAEGKTLRTLEAEDLLTACQEQLQQVLARG